MSASTGSDPVSRTHRPQRRQTVEALLESTDQSLKRGTRSGARVWPTGFDLLDSTLDGGLRSGELVLLGGREGCGRTTFAVQLVRNAILAGRYGVVFSFEQSAQSLVQRLIALEAGTAAVAAGHHASAAADVHTVRSVFEAEDPDRRGLAEALSRIPYGFDALDAVQRYAARLHVHASDKDTTAHEVARVVSAITQEVGEPPVVLVDYLQRMPFTGYDGDEDSRMTVVTEAMKDISRELQCPIVCICAADREALGSGRRMRTRDLRGSSALAYEADLVLVLSSKEDIVSREHLVYDLGSSSRFGEWAVISIEKNRSGLGQIELEVRKDFEHARFHPQVRVVTERLIEERVFTT